MFDIVHGRAASNKAERRAAEWGDERRELQGEARSGLSIRFIWSG